MKIRHVLMGAFLVAAISLAGHWDMQEAERAAAHYNKMVCAGAWPDYDTREPECGE